MTVDANVSIAAHADRVPLPRDAWYVGVASSQLAETPVAVILFGQPIVLFRSAGGVVRALHDRCPHRGVALSLGHIEAGTIACAYHGWRFDGEGACVEVPSLCEGRGIAAGGGVDTYPTAEHSGYVWVWMGGDAPAGLPPPIPGFADHAWLQGRIDLACEAILPIENNLDICHAAFTHPGLHPQWFQAQAVGLQEHAYTLDTTATGLSVISGAVSLRFDLPDRVTVSSEGRDGAFLIVLHHSPTVAGRCVQHWLMRTGPASKEADNHPAWTGGEPEIFAQDRRVMESAQQSYDREGDAFERSVEADATTLRARKIIVLARDGRWPGDANANDSRVIHARS